VLDRILLTNDDGIDAPGLQVLERIGALLAAKFGWSLLNTIKAVSRMRSVCTTQSAPPSVDRGAGRSLARRAIASLWVSAI
jgi:broad specificity polyphosphatase/5'/3'-nucleotidase SurE